MMAMPQAERVAMGQVGVPTQGRAAGPPHAQLPMEDGLSAASQPPANAEQAVIAQADPTADDAKTNNAGAASRGKEPGFAGVEAQAQSAEFASRHIQRLEERLWPIRKESQIIHIAQAHPHSREAAQLMVKTIKVEVGQKLAGEVADGQAPETLQWGEQGVAGEGVNSRSVDGSIGQDAIEQPEGAGTSDQRLQLAPEQMVVDAWERLPDVGLDTPKQVTKLRISAHF